MELQLIHPFEQTRLGNRTFLGTFKNEPVAVKKLPINCGGIVQQNDENWEEIVKLLHDHHLVQYHDNLIQGDTRYLIMDLCQGSLLDYCNKKLDESLENCIEAIDIMWQMTCGLEFLHRNKITHGDLRLENVLFWRKNSNSKWVVVKLSGYGYIESYSEDIFYQDVQGLGSLFHAAATKTLAKSNGCITDSNLSEIKNSSHKSLATNLINIFINDEPKPSAAALLRHPLFTQCVSEAQTRLRESLSDSDMNLVWSEEKLSTWKGTLDNESKFDEEVFEDFKEILFSEKISSDNLSKRMNEAFKTTPKYFSEYIWYTTNAETTIQQKNPREIKTKRQILGKGNYGKVYQDWYTDKNGKKFLVAYKKCHPKKEAEEVFKKEIRTLQQLNHLFVIKYLDVIEEDSKKLIVMELCEGTLKEYFKGELERIPKNSLDEKIIVSQVTLGLSYIHYKNIIHKDLKPDNILLWSHPNTPELVLTKIADFGFAKELKPGQTDFSTTVHPGTESYMAPELLNAAPDNYPASFASDVYSLGVTIGCIVLKGKHPFSSEKIVQTVLMINGVIPPNLQTLSWDLQDLILKLTDKDPDKRPNISCVLRHPYFVLTNEKTKLQFANELSEYLHSHLPEERTKKKGKNI